MPFTQGANIYLANMARLGGFVASSYLNWDRFSPYALKLLQEDASRQLLTVVGDTHLDGSNSINFDGTDDYIDIALSDDLQMGAQDYTISFFMRPSDNLDTMRMIDVKSAIAYKRGAWNVRVKADRTMVFSIDNGGSNENITSVAGIFEWGTEIFVEVIRQFGGTNRIFIDGVQVASAADNSYNAVATIGPLRIGSRARNGTHDYKGTISRLHLSKGIARRTTADSYTPPSQTDAIVTDMYTVLALNGNGDAGSVRIIDSAKPSYDDGAGGETKANAVPGLQQDTSKNLNDATVNGDPIWTAKDGLLAFDGTGDYINIPSISLSGLRTYYWVGNYTKPVTTSDTLWGDVNCLCQMDTNGYIVVNAGTSATMATTDYSSASHRFALEIDASGTAKLYVDGTLVGTQTVGTGANVALGVFARSDGDSPVIGSSDVLMVAQTEAYNANLDRFISMVVDTN